jgi:trk system potassium uptake protein
MRIVIVGGGLYGYFITEKLRAENHDIAIIDTDKEKIDEINANLDVLAINGNGASVSILEKAGIKDSDMLIALTDSDEANIVACMIAKHYNVKMKIARISGDIDNLENVDNKGFIQSLGIDLVISPEIACASEFESLVMSSGIIEETKLADEKVSLVGCKIGDNASIIDKKLKNLNSEKILYGLRFVAILRETNVIIPKGDDNICKEDIVYFMCDKRMVQDVLVWLDVPNYVPDRVIIVGATDIGVALAKRLEDKRVDVKMIEGNEQRASDVSENLKRTMVFNGVATDDSLLTNVGAADVDAFVAVSVDDEKNILSCVLARQMLAKKTFCLIRKPEYVDLVSSVMKINGVINPKHVMINSILRYIRKGNLASAVTLRELEAEVMEVVVDKNSKVVGKKIVELNFPKDAVIGAIIENKKVLPATGDYILKVGDHVFVLLLPTAIHKVESIFSNRLFKIF